MELAVDAPHLRPVPTDGAPPSLDTPDAELVARVAERDRAAFELLYRRYVRSVFGLALRRLRDRSGAEDATQEAFAAIWRAAGTYRPERGPVPGWLYAVARNAIVDRLRRGDPAVPGEVPELVAGGPGPAEQAEDAYVAWRVHRALEDLQPREREVIELAYWSGMSQSEVAAYLGLPLGTVKTRTRSGLARLASLLEEELR
ncbi:MAG TPA: sigma-70 family RNA polymerase sigma factor [Gaiellaceae bacterium]|jgi:RNA polymerase sigma-70 factor (ECF subfamily)|nr:sigma-70 family RNA polymerase sigma factor [Gaiellaceae bacterium]